MSSYRQYLDQIEDLQKKAAAARKTETEGAIKEIKRLIAEFGLSAADVGLAESGNRRRGAKKAGPAARAAGAKKRKSTKSPSAGRKVPPKYQGPQGQLWTGRGRKPAWVIDAIAGGKSMADLTIR